MSIAGRISALFDSTVDNVLLKAAEAIANDARKNAPTHRISANVNISPITSGPQGKEITVYIPLDKAPEARAYELGSGIHSTGNTLSPNQQGPGGKINIDAKNVPNLVFFWQRENRWFVGPHVNHPGVAAKPYLGPAIIKHGKSIRGLINRGILKLINAAIKAGFTEK